MKNILLVLVIVGVFLVGGIWLRQRQSSVNQPAVEEPSVDQSTQLPEPTPDNNSLTEQPTPTMHPSWDADGDGINDCEKEGICDDSVDYTLPRN